MSSTILGSVDFIEAIKDKYLSTKKVDPNLPALKELPGKPSADEITEEVESVFGEDQALARGVKIYLCHKHTGKMLKEIGRQFDIGASGVSQTSRRIAMKISQENKRSKKIRKIENKLNLSRMKTCPAVRSHYLRFFLESLTHLRDSAADLW